MKKILVFCLSVIIQLNLLLSIGSLKAEEDNDVSSNTVQEDADGSDNEILDENSGQDQDVNTKRCQKCGKTYPVETIFCGIDGEKLVEVQKIPRKEDVVPETVDNGKTASVVKESDTGQFDAFDKAMEFIKRGDFFREERNDFEASLVEYKKALELVPDNLQLHYKLAGSYWKLGERDKALEHLDRCKELYPKGAAGITKIDQYIAKLEKGLSAKEIAKRREIKGVKIKEIMSEAVKLNKKKWDEMVVVPEGKFLMGSKEDEFNMEEMPQHEVYLSPYYIDKYEVTNALYWEFLDYINRTNDHSKCSLGEGPNKDHTPDRWYDDSYYEHPGWPVVRIDWYDAYAYAAWAGKRLPTEAEWEKAARGTDGRRFPWGNIWDSKKCNAGTVGSLEVGSCEDGKSVYGAQDMCGSIQEWCNDWHHAMYYTNSPSRDPKGPLESTNLHVIRGSSLFANNVYQMRVTIRWYDEPHRKNRSVGFRCAKDYEAD